MTTMTSRAAELNRSIGERVRIARLMKGMSQTQLGDQLRVTFQQVQKYEKGQSRVSASTLLCISESLETDLLFFYRGVDLNGIAASADIDFSRATALDFDILRGLMKITDPRTKRSIANLVAALEARPASPDGNSNANSPAR